MKKQRTKPTLIDFVRCFLIINCLIVRVPHFCDAFINLFFIFTTALVIGVNFFAPVSTERSTCSNIANSFCNRLIQNVSTLSVRIVIYGSVFINSITSCCFNRSMLAPINRNSQPYFSFCRSIIFFTCSLL